MAEVLVQLLDDVQDDEALRVIEASLQSHHAQALVAPRLAPLMRAVEVFGFHLATVDLRQSSDQHELVIAELLAAAAGKHVALVGNARALSGGRQGAAIDAADLVVRINRAPMTSAESHGTRTDWLALAVRLPEADRQRLDPGRILWMSPKRKRLDWRTARAPGFYLHPLSDYRALKARLPSLLLQPLVENAIKYAGAAEVRLLAEPDRAVIEVADRGPGIPADQLQLIFDKFSRGNKESAIPGVGLGLAICRAIIEVHDGRIWAENGANGGASFRFVLPLEKPPEIDGDAFLIQGEPVRDRERLVWTVDLRPA